MKYNVIFFSFKRQYPWRLFPGRNDTDVSTIGIKEDGVLNILDSINPLSWLRVAYRISRINPNLLIFPWWVSFWALQFWTIATIVKMLANCKVLFLCHNVVEHEPIFMSKACAKFALRKGDYFIVHSQTDMQNLLALYPDAHVKRGFHPTYAVFNFTEFDRQSERKKLGLQGHVILFFGFVRPYKGLRYLILALSKVITQMPVALLVVGEFWENKGSYVQLVNKLDLEDHVIIIDKYVPNEEVGKYFCVCDLVVQPYTSATGSGIVQLAYGFNKPVVVTRVGDLTEVVVNGETGYVVSPESPDEIASAILRYFREDRAREFEENIRKQRDRFSWDNMVKLIESFEN